MKKFHKSTLSLDLSSTESSETDKSSDSSASSSEDLDPVPVRTISPPSILKTLMSKSHHHKTPMKSKNSSPFHPQIPPLSRGFFPWRSTQSTSTYSRAKITWRIDKFQSVIEPVHSEIFEAKEQLKSDNKKHPESIAFRLEMIPNQMYHMDWFAVFKITTLLHLDKCITVCCRFSAIDASGKRCLTQDSKTKLKKNSFGKSSNGFFSLSREYILDSESGLLKDNALTVFCEIEIIDDNFNETPIHQQLASTTKVLLDYATLLESGKYSDVLLVVGKDGAKKEIHAHKNILTARSPVFGAMFEHKNTKEAQESRVEITDVHVDTFEHFIRYIYTGKVTLIGKYALELLTVADKYQMDCLKTQCSHYLSSNLTIELVSSILVLADLHNSAELKSNCVDYIADHAEEVMATKDFKLLKNMPEVMFELFQKHVKKSKK